MGRKPLSRTRKTLTTKQREALRCIERGMDNLSIVRELHIDIQSVYARVNGIYDALMLSTDVKREELPERARQQGFVLND